MTDRIPSVGGEGHNTWQTHHASSNHAAKRKPGEERLHLIVQRILGLALSDTSTGKWLNRKAHELAQHAYTAGYDDCGADATADEQRVYVDEGWYVVTGAIRRADTSGAVLDAIPNRASDFDPDIEHPVHLGKATPEETIRVNTGKANVRDATPNSVAEIRADERRRIAAEIEQLEPRYPNLVSRAAIRGLLRG